MDIALSFLLDPHITSILVCPCFDSSKRDALSLLFLRLNLPQRGYRVRKTPELTAELKAITKGHECAHQNTELRRMIMKGGSAHYSLQCLKCGVSAKFVSSSEVQNAGDIPEYDYSLKDAYRDDLERKRKEARERHRMLQTSDGVERQLWYSEYLQTPEWKDRWRLVMERAKGVCEGCGKSQARQVHHLTYEHAGNEFLWELRAVCHPCHERVHEKDMEA